MILDATNRETTLLIGGVLVHTPADISVIEVYWPVQGAIGTFLSSTPPVTADANISEFPTASTVATRKSSKTSFIISTGTEAKTQLIIDRY